MKPLYTILESSDNPSDDAIYYRLGLIKLSGNKRMKEGHNWPKEGTPEYRRAVIKLAKKLTAPILPDNKNIIKRSAWDVEAGTGISEKNLMWPHFWTYMKWCRENHKRQHDTLVVFECSNRKPYGISPVPAHLYASKYMPYCDMCACNAGPIPYELSHHYPVRFDEWRHNLEEPSIRYKYMMISGHRFLRYVKALGYKDVVVCMQNPDTQIIFDELLKHNVNGCAKWLHIVSTKEAHDDFLRANPQFRGSGLAIQRFMSTSWTQKRFHKELAKYIDKDDAWDSLTKIVDMRSGSAKKTELKQWQEENNVKYYDMEAGVDTQIDPIDPKDVIDNKLKNKFKRYLEKKIKKLEENAEKFMDDKTLDGMEMYKQRYLFGALDLLLDYYDAGELGSYNPKFFTSCKDCDEEYWNMHAALNELLEDDPNWEHIKDDDAIWYYVPVAKHYKKSPKAMLEISDSLMLTSQFMTLDWLLDHPA